MDKKLKLRKPNRVFFYKGYAVRDYCGKATGKALYGVAQLKKKVN
jgi:hypothetical protein